MSWYQTLCEKIGCEKTDNKIHEKQTCLIENFGVTS